MSLALGAGTRLRLIAARNMKTSCAENGNPNGIRSAALSITRHAVHSPNYRETAALPRNASSASSVAAAAIRDGTTAYDWAILDSNQ